jgi:molybdopterin converting factor small subunit
MGLKKILEIYRAKKQVPSEQEIKEIFENVEPEPVTKNLAIPQVETSLTVPYRVKEGDIIQIFPSVDGLDMYFLVWGVFPEENLVRLMLLSEFTEFATPKDVIVNLKGEDYMVQTDLFIALPYEGLGPSIGRLVFKVGEISEGELQRISEVFFGEAKGDGKMVTPTKGLFKKEEAQRLAQLMKEYIQKQEEYVENLEKLKAHLKKQPALAASEKERNTFVKDNFYAKYDRERGLLIITPKKDLVYSIGKVTLNVEGEEIPLYEGVIYENLLLPLPEELYNWEVLAKGLKLEVY